MRHPALSPFLCLLALLCMAVTAHAQAPVHECYVVEEYSHNVESSTQGLFYYNGELYESSGGYGKSFIARVDIDSGKHIKKRKLAETLFAEGMAPIGNSFLMLTWKSGKGFVYRLGSLKWMGEFKYPAKAKPNEGWGLTYNGDKFIMSDGSARLHQHTTDSFARTASITVKDGGKPVRMLNELEYVNRYILANIWKSDRIAIIDAATANVVAWIDLSPLRDRLWSGAGVANGIAFDEGNGRLFVTGKNWDRLFAIEIDGFSLF